MSASIDIRREARAHLQYPQLRYDVETHRKMAAMWLSHAKLFIRRAQEPRRRKATLFKARITARICLVHALVARECARLLAAEEGA